MLKNQDRANICEAGCDEAGRGCLCGPVCAAAVVLPPDFECPGLNDSKQLTESKREELRPLIERGAVAWAVAAVSAEEIDRINILRASILAMHRALGLISAPSGSSLFDDDERGGEESDFQSDVIGGETYLRSGGDCNLEIGHIIVDGNRFRPFRDIPYTTIVKGDGKYMSIAAASVLAKTHRDAIMRRLAEEYPGYDWASNMGYPTKAHIAALQTLGLTPHHRRTFAPCRNILCGMGC